LDPVKTDYASNSNKVRRQRSEDDTRPAKRARQVAQGRKREKSSSSILINSLLPGDADEFKRWVIEDKLIPGVKSSVRNFLIDMIDGFFGGPGRRTHSTNASYTSYSRYSSKSRDDHREPYRDKRRLAYDYNDVILETRGDAEEVLDALEDLLAHYKVISVADLYDIVGVDSDFTDFDYGWTNIDSSYVKRVDHGYVIVMPKASPIDK